MKIVVSCPTRFEWDVVAPVVKAFGLPGIICGVGPARSACSLTKYMENHDVSTVLLAGLGGAYLEGCLGQVFLASSEVFADLGRCTTNRLESFEGEDFAPQHYFPNLIKDSAVSGQLTSMSDLTFAPMATVSCASGDLKRAEMIRRQFDVMVENMEGASAALVCLEYGASLLELRAISNRAGVIDKEKWDIRGALHRLKGAVEMLIDYLVNI